MMKMLAESHFCKNEGNFILKLDGNIELDEFCLSPDFEQLLKPVEFRDEGIRIVEQRRPEFSKRLDVTNTHKQAHKIFADRVDVGELVAEIVNDEINFFLE